MAVVGGGMTIDAAAPGVGSLVFRMQVSGYEPVSVALSRFGDRIKDFRPFWIEYFAPSFYRSIQRNFELEGQAVGGWAPLSPAYKAWKDQHYPGKTILRRTDALFRSLTFDGRGAGPRGIFLPDQRQLVLGTSVAYAQYHQFAGAFRSRGLLRALRQRMPRRFLFVPQRAASTFGRLLHAFAVDQADDVGLRVAAARARGVSSGLL
ncbi:MAG TPA: phage virion morphogenesis protein [Vicinamibacterales bacterium]|nr:phage virion morphogenesis protein [Vicinamibacterales bacterium]